MFWKIARHIATSIAIMFVGSTVAHFLAVWLVQLLHVQLSDVWERLTTTWLTIFIMMLMAFTTGMLMRDRGRRTFLPLIEAIRRIGRGELHEPIQIPEDQKRGVFGELLESINEMAGELSQMEKMRQEFISNVSHEFQSPLTSIGGFARALRNEELDRATRGRYLDIIERECGRLSRLSDNLMKLTSLESEHQPVHLHSYRLDRQLRNVVLHAEPQWAGKELDVEAELEELTVTADEELMSQVWTNLLHNSIKFTPNGGSIRIRAAVAADGGCQIDICDSGIGMSEEEQEHVFERFYKADKARGRESGGSGLGLAIVKKIVDLHRGDIRVCSTPGVGSTFTVKLPGPASLMAMAPGRVAENEGEIQSRAEGEPS